MLLHKGNIIIKYITIILQNSGYFGSHIVQHI